MNELDAMWDEMLAEAAKRAPTGAPALVSEFLALKTANDEIRQMSVKWLLDAMTEAAAHANRQNANISIENETSHRFAYHNASLVGPLVRFRQGVRCLTIEAGWTRAPGDGFMRGNALAVARITHFGISKANAELHLLRFEDRPRWFTISKDGMKISFELRDLIEHFQIFLGAG